MPELPEVETTRRGVRPHLTGQRILAVVVRNPRLRWPLRPDLDHWLTGRRILEVGRRAKYLLISLEGEATLIIHLGMSGSLRLVEDDCPPGKHDHVDLLLESGRRLRYHDPRRFGAILDHQGPGTHPRLEGLGPEPLSEAFDGEYLIGKAAGRRLAIKKLIMTNAVVVGVGNIYANEALFMAGLHPATPAGDCEPARLRQLADRIKEVLEKAIEQGGTTLRDFLREDGQPGYFAQTLQVYGRSDQPCRACGTPIHRMVLDQRACYYCPVCQSSR